LRLPARIALTLALFAAAGCGDGARPNLLFIVVDTLRADHLQAYGYGRATSPAIASLAADSVLFRRAYATAPWTQPSVASMITGLHPATHGVERFQRVLPGSAETLAEVLSSAGYATGAVVSHWLIGARFHFDQGYASFEEATKAGGADAVTTPQVTSRALAQLRQMVAGEPPFYLFVHYFDPHYTYRRHPEVGFAGEKAGRLGGDEGIWDLRALEPAPNAAERTFIRDLYDEEIRFTDTGVARLLGGLQHLGVADDTLVVFVADHGEEFFERGWLGHTRTLYDELIRVPLLIRIPGARSAGRVVEEPVSLVSLMPTLLDLMGIEGPGEVQGATFAPLMTDAGEWQPEPILSEVVRWDERASEVAPSQKSEVPARTMVHKRAVVVGRHKLVVDLLSGKQELYDLERDPRERDDLASREPDRVRELAAEMDAVRAAADAAALPRIGAERIRSEAEAQHLIDLGYISP
jgi:arylsulfatase A-like enzyme